MQTFIFFFTLSILISVIGGCDSNSDTTIKPSITVAVARTPLSAPFYIAQQQNLFDANCVDITFTDVIGGHNSFAALIKNKADFATSSDTVIVYQSSARDDFIALGSFVQSDNDVKLVIHNNKSLTSTAQGEKLKVAVAKDSSSEYLLTLYLAFKGIPLDNVLLIDMAPDSMPIALANGKVDAISIWEPYAFNAVSMLESKVNVLPTRNLYTLTFNLLSTRAFIAANREASQCLMEGIFRAENFIAEFPQIAKSIVRKKLELNQQFIDWIWQDYFFKLSLGQSFLLNLESQAKWINSVSNERKITDVDFDKLVYPDILTEIDPAAVSIRLKTAQQQYH